MKDHYTKEEFAELMKKKGLTIVTLSDSLLEALVQSDRVTERQIKLLNEGYVVHVLGSWSVGYVALP